MTRTRPAINCRQSKSPRLALLLYINRINLIGLQMIQIKRIVATLGLNCFFTQNNLLPPRRIANQGRRKFLPLKMFLIELFGLNADADSSPKIRHWENEIIYADFFFLLFFNRWTKM